MLAQLDDISDKEFVKRKGLTSLMSHLKRSGSVKYKELRRNRIRDEFG